jgi:hypothetical protein
VLHGATLLQCTISIYGDGIYVFRCTGVLFLTSIIFFISKILKFSNILNCKKSYSKRESLSKNDFFKITDCNGLDNEGYSKKDMKRTRRFLSIFFVSNSGLIRRCSVLPL